MILKRTIILFRPLYNILDERNRVAFSCNYTLPGGAVLSSHATRGFRRGYQVHLINQGHDLPLVP